MQCNNTMANNLYLLEAEITVIDCSTDMIQSKLFK